MTQPGFSPERLARMQELMARHVDEGTVPGLVTAVNRGAETQVDALGLLAFGGDQPMQRDTIFRLASVTKPIVAVAAMILVDQGVLGLDDPVDSFLPELAGRQVLRRLDSELDDTVPAHRPISMRDLLTFRLGHGMLFAPPATCPIQVAMEALGVTPGAMTPRISPDEYMRRLGSLPLIHQPGERWLYNTGADVLGVLIMRATGQSLDAAMRERIFDPLGMVDTGFHVPPAQLHRLATCYAADPDSGELAVFDGVEDSLWRQPPPLESGASGLVSTAGDVLAFGRMMLNQGRHGDVQIVSQAAVEMMTTDQILPAQKVAADFFPGFWDNATWGLGLAIDVRPGQGARTPGSFGWDGGYGTSWYADPSKGLQGLLLTQRLLDVEQMMVFQDFWTATYEAVAG